MQPALFVPESKTLDELLGELKSKPMAICVNEYGGAEGILTMEDVMEEVVGEIEDEYDEPPRLYRRISENSYIVNAHMEIFDLQNELHLPIPEGEDYQTLAGFLLKRMQKIPKKWDSIVIDGVEYVVQSATDRSIEEVYLVIRNPTTNQS
jgi:CBS domain containing-hemolysin-like protein